MIEIKKIFTARDAENMLPKLKGKFIFLVEHEGQRGGYAFGIHTRPFIYVCFWFDFGIYRFWKLVVGKVRNKYEWHYIRKRRIVALLGGHVYFQTDNSKCVSVYHGGQSFET